MLLKAKEDSKAAGGVLPEPVKQASAVDYKGSCVGRTASQPTCNIIATSDLWRSLTQDKKKKDDNVQLVTIYYLTLKDPSAKVWKELGQKRHLLFRQKTENPWTVEKEIVAKWRQKAQEVIVRVLPPGLMWSYRFWVMNDDTDRLICS